jgi:hypothetical protein
MREVYYSVAAKRESEKWEESVSSEEDSESAKYPDFLK